jgi:hypothetical protein
MDRLVLTARTLPTLDAADDVLDHLVEHFLALRRGLPEGHELLAAPAVEVRTTTRLPRLLAAITAFELHGQRLVVAKDKDRFAVRGRLREPLGAVAEDERLA